MIRSLDGLALRQLRTRRLRALLTTFGIVLGVGMVCGVLLLVGTIHSTFSDLIDSAWGETDVVVNGVAGGTMPQDTLARVEGTDGVRAAAGMVGAQFARLGRDGKPVEGLKGKMMVAGYEPGGYQPYDFRMVSGRKFRSGEDELIVDRTWADDVGVRVGQPLHVATATGDHTLRVVGIFELKGGASFGQQALSAMPLDRARRIMDVPRGWMQVSVAASDRSRASEMKRALERELGTGIEVKTPSGVLDDVEKQLGQLNVVLYFFSGIALFVGIFLILNAFHMTVTQRMREIGTLRTLGANRGTIVRTVLVEALVLGLVGSVLGLALGVGLALLLLEAIKSMGVPAGTLSFSALAPIVAVIAGLLATTAGAAYPAIRASRLSPIRAVLGQAEQRRKPPLRRLVVGLALFLPGALLGGSFWFGDVSNRGGIYGLLGIVLTMTMFAGMVVSAPWTVTPLVRLLAAPMRRLFPTAGRLAADASRSNPVRTAATAAALTIGLSVVVVNSSMSASFIDGLRDQMTASLARDTTIRPTDSTLYEGGMQTVPRAVSRKVAALPEAGIVTPVRVLLFDLPKGNGAAEVQGLAEGIDPAVFGEVDRSPVSGASREDALRAVGEGQILIGRNYAETARLDVGDTLPLVGPRGRRDARIAAIIESNTEFGGQVIQMSLATLAGVYGVTQDAQVAVKATDDAQAPALQRRIDALLAREYPALEAASAAEMRKPIEDQINMQFGLFNAIVGIAIIVSLLGVVNTLAMSVMERTREIGVLRALGSTRWLVRWTMVDESVLVTSAGALSGLALGLLIAWIWVGQAAETMPGMAFAFPAATVVLTIVLSILCGALAAILPARRAAKLDPVKALTYE